MTPPYKSHHTIDCFFVAAIRDVGHLYWPYSRETLCGRNKVHKPAMYWWQWEGPMCDECLIAKTEQEMQHGREERGIAA